MTSRLGVLSEGNSKTPGFQVRGFLATYRVELVAIALFSAVINVLMLSPTLYMLQVFDRVMLSRSELTLLVLTLIVLFFYGVQAYSEWYRFRIVNAVGIRLDQSLNDPLFQATLRERFRTLGMSPVQAFADLAIMRNWITSQGVFSFFDLPWSPIYLAVMFFLHPTLGWLTIAFMAILGGVAWWTSVGTAAVGEESEDEERELNEFIHAKLRNAEVIEAHGMVPNLMRRWWDRQVGTLSLQSKAHDIDHRFSSMSKEVRTLMQSLALAAGALLTIEGEISPAAMVAASLLMGRATAPIDQIVAGWASFINVRRCFTRVQKVLALEGSIGVSASQPDAASATPSLGSVVEVHHGSFTVTGRSEPILQDINLSFKPGTVYCVLGNSGAGKSTLGRLLLGLVKPDHGQVLVGGVPIASIPRAALGPWIGYVPQDIELFAASVGENIARMGEPDPERVIEAAELTGTHQLILRLPKSYDTQIGDSGAYLSGGQRQRVALARAVYGNPGLLVLDEPNANLDDAGEQALARAVVEMKKRGAIIVLITHRPSALALADELVVMDRGRVQIHGAPDDVKKAIRSGVVKPLGAPSAQPPDGASPAEQPSGNA
jgi:ATP-binding cassette subfamily C exporter for protease/lipase